ncbi:uncharacterized protein BDW70DRAFT_138563 [Aspergillus foveolatus]|uniref:uncharacterized protein n=1 Tax=Aspergillus foveolatus TaxID=210207 RepID=UPI003CCCB7C2
MRVRGSSTCSEVALSALSVPLPPRTASPDCTLSSLILAACRVSDLISSSTDAYVLTVGFCVFVLGYVHLGAFGSAASSLTLLWRL